MRNDGVNTSSILAHPILIFVGSWTFVYFLYSLGLSELLIYDVGDFVSMFACMILPFLVGYWYTRAMLYGMIRGTPYRQFNASFRFGDLDSNYREVIWRRILGLLKLWALATIVEIVVSGGIPILWVITRSGRNYQDFGIASVHGLLMSVLLSCSMVSFYLYLETGIKKYRAIPLFALCWFIVSITRGFFIGIILQTLFLYLCARRLTIAQIIKIGIGFLCLILFFGLVGDLRSEGGNDLIRAIGRPTERFPDWLPSGFLWVYIYMSTPLNNLFHTANLNPSVNGISIAVTTSQLFPTVIRNALLPESSLRGGDMVDSNLNVSTSYMGPYLDMGLTGIVVFSLFLGATGSLFWALRSRRLFFLGYAFVAHALALSIFFDVMLFLPYLFQLFWFWYLLRPSRQRHRQTDFRLAHELKA